MHFYKLPIRQRKSRKEKNIAEKIGEIATNARKNQGIKFVKFKVHKVKTLCFGGFAGEFLSVYKRIAGF